MHISTTEIFNASVKQTSDADSPTIAYYSSSDFYDLLGRGETLVLQLVADSAATSGTPKKMAVRMERSNDGKVWDAPPEAMFHLSLNDGSQFPATVFFDSKNVAFEREATMFLGSVALGAKVRFRIASEMDAAVRLIASVRGEAGR